MLPARSLDIYVQAEKARERGSAKAAGKAHQLEVKLDELSRAGTACSAEQATFQAQFEVSWLPLGSA